MGRRPRQAAPMTHKNFPTPTGHTPPDERNTAPPPFTLARDTEVEPTVRYPFTYHGPSNYENFSKRQHREFKALSKEERQRIVEEEAADTDLLARTVHLRFLPSGMLQGELASLCAECGEFLRVRLCGNFTVTQNWIYGFVEFADCRGAERMLQRSGMEMPNGSGKPPLRLKCDTAKQAIVDRVFHDADPATNMKCIFGSGNFAYRTLKEAVDSYYNLKRKESEMMAAQRNSHFPPSIGNTNNYTPRNNEVREIHGNWHTPASRHYPKAHEGPATLMCPPALVGGYRSQSLSNSDEEPAGITPPLHVSTTHGNGIVSGDNVRTPPPYPHPTQPMCLTNRLGIGNNYDEHSDGVMSHDGKTSPQFMPPFTAIPLGFEPHFPLPSNPQDPTVVRGKALVLSSIRNAQMFVSTGEKFYDAVGSLRALLSVLDGHIFHVGRLEVPKGTSNTLMKHERAKEKKGGEGEEDDEETSQRITQLRLLAHFFLSLLYLQKGKNEECLSSIHSVVMCCSSIPVKKVQRTCPLTAPTGPASLASPHPVCASSGIQAKEEKNEKEKQKEEQKEEEKEEEVLPIGSDLSVNEETSCTFNPISQAFDFFGEINFGGEDENETTVVNAALGVLPLEEHEASLEQLKAHKEPNHEQDMNLQAYVLNILLAIGLSMELVQPVVTRCVYVLASTRSKEVFGATLPELEQTLLDGGVHRLRPVLFPQVEDRNFVKVFFESLNLNETMSDDVFWSSLLPHHMVRFFPRPKGDAPWQLC
ncbi:RNA-binding protein, putative [Trypanosoma cruzi marinkellei]|uniref:RNA-binding protein, putative n=1 Tax=Trypanosoma cruzi marinkellei TaxID=85056 RepID=K2NK95_TRYCR|nr:RNA-binding protein, putative [Trypanosoma cruzi marinkellei]